MKTRSILPFAVFGFLLLALFALSSCGDDEPSATPTPSPEVSPVGIDATQFRGPYPFALTEEEDKTKKKLDFECYKKLGLSLSEAVELTNKLFTESIGKNKEFPDTQEYDTQKYNYVIDTEGKIIVSQWNVENIEVALKAARDKAKANANCGGRKCLEDGDFIPDVSNKKVMVNVFPEDKTATPKQSPCWLDRDKKDEGPGLLDAISKHLMLAQGASDNGEGATIDMFNENDWSEWMAKKVRYAGVFFVDVEESCISDVDGDSGTYQPKTSYQTLKKVWEYFGNTFKLCN